MRSKALGLLAIHLVAAALITSLADSSDVAIDSATPETSTRLQPRTPVAPISCAPAPRRVPCPAPCPAPHLVGLPSGPQVSGSASPAETPRGILILTVDHRGEPVAGVAVGLSQVTRPAGIRVSRRLGVSGSDGVLIVSVRAAGRLVVDRPGLRGTGVDFDPSTAASATEHRVVCAPTAPLRIRALDSSGRPLVGARLELSSPEESSAAETGYSDPTGYAGFPAVAMGTQLDLTICRNAVRFTQRIHGPRHPDGETVEVEFAPRVATLTGRVFDRNGPIAERTLRCTFGDSGVRSSRVRTDADGRFEILLPAASAEVVRSLGLDLLHADRLSGFAATVSLSSWRRDPATAVELILDRNRTAP